MSRKIRQSDIDLPYRYDKKAWLKAKDLVRGLGMEYAKVAVETAMKRAEEEDDENMVYWFELVRGELAWLPDYEDPLRNIKSLVEEACK